MQIKQAQSDGSDNYDFFISYAGEDKAKAKELYEALKKAGVKVFFAEVEAAKLWGKDMYQGFQSLIRKARFFIPLISENYRKKVWTNHELKQAQAKAFEKNEEYILPLRLDDTEIPGMNQTVFYLDLREKSIQEVVEAAINKLNSTKNQ